MTMAEGDVRRIRPPTPRVALLLGAAALLLVLFYLGRGALGPFIVGLIIIYVLDPAVEWLSHRRIPLGGRARRIPRAVAVLIVYALAVVLLIEGFSFLIGPLVQQIGEFGRDLPGFLAALEEQLRRLSDVYDRLTIPDALRQAIDRALANLQSGAGGLDLGSLLPIARSIAGLFGSIFGFLVIPVWAFYILKDRDGLIAAFDRALPEAWRADAWAMLGIVDHVFGRWLRGQLLLGLAVGVATFLGLLALGVLVNERFIQFAVLLAVVAGVFELLPIIGPILSMIPTILVALTISPGAVLAVVLLYLLVQQIENNVLVPKIQGDAIELHPSVVIFALVLGGAIAGLLGAIFALPVTAAARDIFRYLFRRLGDESRGPVPAEEAARSVGVHAEAPPPEEAGQPKEAGQAEPAADLERSREAQPTAEPSPSARREPAAEGSASARREPTR
jgi:predicted PurR-regulated permease PerM